MCPLVPVLAAPFLFGERLRRPQIAGVALALAAIALLNTTPSPDAPAGAPGLLSRWMLFTLLSLALFGLTFLTQKSATYHVSDELSAIGFAGGFLLLDAFLIYDGPGLAWPLPNGSAWASLLIGVTMGLGSLTLFAAYRRGKASIVSPYSQLFPVITVLAAGPLYQEKLDLLRGIGVFAAIVAGVLLSIEKPEPKPEEPGALDAPAEEN
jgi:drug/metabolite transporter (DMT)-like permease